MKRKHRGYGDTFYIDEVFVKINGKQHYLWRAVDQDGEVVDVFLQARRDGAAAKRFLKRLLRSHGGEPRKIVTDKLRSYSVAHRELIPEMIHSTKQYENNRVDTWYVRSIIGIVGKVRSLIGVRRLHENRVQILAV